MKTIKRSIAIILCLISVGALCGCGSGAKGPEAALKEYFEAYNKMDLEAIHNATYPEGTEATCRELLCENDYDYYEYWKEDMGFPRSEWDSSDYAPLQSLPNFKVMYEEYPMVYEGENGILVDAEGNQLTLKEALPDFSISYEIIEMASFEDCTVRETYRTVIEDMNEIVPAYIDTDKIAVEEMYVAKLNVEWFYGNNLYGFNPDWWQDKDYSEMGPYTYEEWIEEYASKEYIVFMYKYEGEWYVYPEILELAHIIWEVEF